jgi:transposase
MNSGKTVFSQIMQLIPRRDFNEIVAKYKGDYRVRNLSCQDQFLVMCMAQYADKNSLRDIEASLNALAVVRKLYHCGISYAVPRNTLAKANENRDWHIYAELGEALIKKVRPLYAKDKFRLDIDNMVYAFDSTTISLCLKLCPWAKFRKNKGGIKMHTQIDLRGNLPVFIHLTRASVHDVNAMDEICVEMGAIYLMDKGYVDFFRLFNNIHKNGAFFVTRAKDNMQYEVVSSREVDLQTGVISDQMIRLTEEASVEKYPDEFRMVVHEDYATGNVYRFITNHTGYEALTIAELYKERWNVELFFKWIKQHLHIKSFYGTSENAVYTQIWIAVCAFLLLALAKKKMHIDEPSLYMISQTIGTMLFEKIPVRELFNKPNLNVSSDDGQLELFRDRKS